MISTREPVDDVKNLEDASAPRLDLEQLSDDDGAELLRLLSTAVDALDHKIAAVTKGLAPESGTHATSQAVEEI